MAKKFSSQLLCSVTQPKQSPEFLTGNTHSDDTYLPPFFHKHINVEDWNLVIFF